MNLLIPVKSLYEQFSESWNNKRTVNKSGHLDVKLECNTMQRLLECGTYISAADDVIAVPDDLVAQRDAAQNVGGNKLQYQTPRISHT